MSGARDDRTTESRDASDPTSGASRLGAYRITVVEGPDRGATIDIDASAPSRVLVGTGAACELRLTDPQVSRRHAAADPTARGLRLTDLGSTNGTRVNQLAIESALLEGGEVVRIGRTSMRVDVLQAARELHVSPSASFGRVIGGSVAMRRLYPLCERLALSDLPVVIEGETGTGKELLAEAFHEEGPRRSHPFVVLDAAGTPTASVGDVLFGSGGLVEQAGRGTLFLDEVSELSLDAQARLLRFLDDSEARVIAATRQNLDKEVHAGRFREDLFFRLAVARVELPPLRDREGDVALLARYFWKRASRDARPFPTDLLAHYESYAWPGNVRELENAIARRWELGPFEHVGRASQPPAGTSSASAAVGASGPDLVDRVLAKDLSFSRARAEIVAAFEARYVTHIVAQHGGSITRAAAASGLALRYFQVLRARARTEGKT